MANNPWGAAIGPLALGAIHNLPKGAKEHLPKFSGDGKVTTTEYLNAFKVACGVLAVQHEDVAMRLFVQNFTDLAADWFYHLPDGAITNWQVLIDSFEARFKLTEDKHSLIAQLAQLKKEIIEPMRDFVSHFNKLFHKIPICFSGMMIYITSINTDISLPSNVHFLFLDVCNILFGIVLSITINGLVVSFSQ